jgi:phage terminase large subunit GpA-like protein
VSKSVYSSAFAQGLRPEPPLLVWEWADKHRFLAGEGAAEPGPYSSTRTPFLREIMECLSSSSPVIETVFMKGAQLGGSEAGNNWVGSVIDTGAGSMIILQPDEALAKDYSKQRLQSMIDATPRLRGKISEVKAREGGNSTLSKKYPGGRLFMGGAKSAPKLCSKPVGKLFLDEIDRYPQDVGNEGDPISLVEARARTFGRKKKIFKCSTPTIDGRSRIQAAYERSDKRHYHVPCPFCGHMQWLKWRQLQWPEGKPEEVRYICENDACKKAIEEHHKTWMFENGKWIAENPGAGRGLIAGFHLSSLYSPVGWMSWVEVVQTFLDAKADPAKMKSFVNTVLGEVWKEKGEAPPWKLVYDRREKYTQGIVPKRGILITAGADVQKDRIEVSLYAWGPGRESWLIDHRVIEGDTSLSESDDKKKPSPWQKLNELLDEQFRHEASGVMIPIRMLAIDSGYRTQHVYAWARRHSRHRVMVVKGMENQQVALGQPGAVDVSKAREKRIRRGLKVWPVGVSLIKEEFYDWLRLELPVDGARFPPGFCHYPEMNEEFCRQLTSEEIVFRKVRGYKQAVWEKRRERNEALDCRVYARAAAAALGIDRFGQEVWAELASEIGAEHFLHPQSESSVSDDSNE